MNKSQFQYNREYLNEYIVIVIISSESTENTLDNAVSD